jgi:4-hydroxy-3-polyprenylbenzoate decarboxylase
MTTTGRVLVGITGASGAAYAQRLIQLLIDHDREVHLIVSTWGKRLLNEELGMRTIDLAALSGDRADRVQLHSDQNLGASVASGSFQHDGMVILPCSTNTLGSLASGINDSLIQRAGACCLKERRRLIVCHRETPLSLIELENMTRLTRAGAIIAPLSPGFYLAPDSIDALLDFMCARVLDLLGIEHALGTRWEEYVSS